jgi:hypothetical protein
VNVIVRSADLERIVSGALRRIQGWLFGALIVATVATFAVVSPAFRDELQNSFVPQPVGFTELYFDASRTQVFATPDGRGQVAVGFVIENRGEAHDRLYSFRVWAAGPAQQVLAERTEQIVIPIDTRQDVNVLLDLPASDQLAAVEVELLGRPEQIRDVVPIGQNP